MLIDFLISCFCIFLNFLHQYKWDLHDMRVKLLSHGFQCIPKKENTFLKSLRNGEIFFMRAHAALIGSDVSKLQICYQQIHEFVLYFS